jgi:hypothetical protein
MDKSEGRIHVSSCEPMDDAVSGPPEGWPIVGQRIWARDRDHPHYKDWGLGIYLGPNENPTSKDRLPHFIQYIWGESQVRHSPNCKRKDPRDCYRCSRDADGIVPGTPMMAAGAFAEICWSPGELDEPVKAGIFL